MELGKATWMSVSREISKYVPVIMLEKQFILMVHWQFLSIRHDYLAELWNAPMKSSFFFCLANLMQNKG